MYKLSYFLMVFSISVTQAQKVSPEEMTSILEMLNKRNAEAQAECDSDQRVANEGASQAQTSKENQLSDDIKAAHAGVAEAQYRLGSFYLEGRGVPQSYQEAFRWYRKAAEQGHKVAQYNLAWMYDRGDGTKQNDKEALYWFERSAYAGVVKAQHTVAHRYYEGKGAPRNLALAYAWLALAASNNVLYQADKEFVFNQLSPSEVKEAQQILQRLLQGEEEKPKEVQNQKQALQEKASHI